MKVKNKRGMEVDAVQWFENGDHPDDFPAGAPSMCPFEGRVVRYFRYPGVDGQDLCRCGQPYHIHGWIDDDFNGKLVCPGDWIITDAAGNYHRYSPRAFELNHDRTD